MEDPVKEQLQVVEKYTITSNDPYKSIKIGDTLKITYGDGEVIEVDVDDKFMCHAINYPIKLLYHHQRDTQHKEYRRCEVIKVEKVK